MYLTATRPDLIFVDNKISKYMEHHVKTHLMNVTKILRYLKGIIELGIQYKKQEHSELIAFKEEM